MDIKTVGVIGAGQMGNGIAHVMALAGYDVTLNDLSQDALTAALAKIEKNMVRQVSRNLITEADMQAGLARISPALDVAALGTADLVIESATENEDIKNKIIEGIVPHLPEHTIITSNTSSISITRLAARTDRPEKFMGFHFMNPVPLMQLVELIRGIATDDET
ncbi:3-hydroxyacyl-CoA dehydrogenase NAD-binding domain-containing protein, partial [Lentibacter algarum]